MTGDQRFPFGVKHARNGRRPVRPVRPVRPQLASESCPWKPNAQDRGHVRLKWRATIFYALAKHDDRDSNPDSRNQSGHQPGAQP
jgi:hypothetical protein